MSNSSHGVPADLRTVRVIPIMKPGGPGVSIAIATNDEDEEKVRANAVARGLVPGIATALPPNPQFWSLIAGR